MPRHILQHLAFTDVHRAKAMEAFDLWVEIPILHCFLSFPCPIKLNLSQTIKIYLSQAKWEALYFWEMIHRVSLNLWKSGGRFHESNSATFLNLKISGTQRHLLWWYAIGPSISNCPIPLSRTHNHLIHKVHIGTCEPFAALKDLIILVILELKTV